MLNKKIKNICCIGAGYVGGPTMAVLAKYCPDIQITVTDNNVERIKDWNSEDFSKLPIYEPGLDEIVSKFRGKNLHFSSEVEKNISIADMIFISVNTPTKTKGIGAGKASDIKWVEACARLVAKHAKKHTIIVEKSTLPVRTAEVIKNILESATSSKERDNSLISFDVLSNPEFLSEGSAIKDLENPDRVLIGGDNNEAILALSKIYEKWVPIEKILYTSIWSSELAKLTANAFLAQRISSINSIGAICESTGADVREVARAIGTDTRIGAKFLDAGPGFGGSCFKKDILNLVYLASYFGLDEVANFWESVVKLNYWHQNRISKLIVEKLYGTLSEKKIAILGFAFKANTNDTRESAAIKICKELIEEGAILSIYDPKVFKKQIMKDLNLIQNPQEDTNELTKSDKVSIANNIQETFKNADAVLILTEWSEFSTINWEIAYKLMRKPAWVFDSRSIVNPEQVINANLKLWRIGDGS